MTKITVIMIMTTESMSVHCRLQMLQVYGFIEEPKLLLHGRGKAVLPTIMAQHLRDTQEGLLVAAIVALHENSKIRLEEADLFFQVHTAHREACVCVSLSYSCVRFSLSWKTKKKCMKYSHTGMGACFRHWLKNIKGNCDVFNITQRHFSELRV